MTKNTMIYKKNRANVAALKLKAEKNISYLRDVNSAERLVCSAAVLPKRAFLGVEVSADKAGKIHTYIFSSPRIRVTENDYAWIFEGLAKVSSMKKASLSPGFEGMKSYAVHYKSEIRSEKPEAAKANGSNGYAESLSDIIERARIYAHIRNMLIVSGAVMQIFVEGANNERSVYSQIFFHFPSKIPLKVRAMISIIFPGASLEEIDKDSTLSTFRIPTGDIMEQIQHLLHSFRPLKGINISHGSSYDCLNEDFDGSDEDMGYPDFDDDDDEEEDDKEGFFIVPKQEIPFDTSKVPGSDKPFSYLEKTWDLDYIIVSTYKCLRKAGIFYVDQIRNKTDEQLLKIDGIDHDSLENIRKSVELLDQGAACLLHSSYMDMLNELIGLKGVKEQMKKIAAYAKMKKDMPVAGNLQMALNMAFVGNPGTAKTTVARLIAGILFENGLLESPDIVEVGRADLIAIYEGQTADKVKSVFMKAKGRLLFIDEAYSLQENIGEFGPEAINTIVQEMENRRDDTVVVFAGYPNEMEAFISSNPGLRSRIPFKITFEDYSAEELYNITEFEIAKRGFTISPDAVEPLKDILQVAAGNPKAGNGRFCRNIVEKGILNYSARIYGDRKKGENDYTLMPVDFEMDQSLIERNQEHQEQPKVIGFRA